MRKTEIPFLKRRTARSLRALLGMLAISVALSSASPPRVVGAASPTGSITSRGAAATAAYAADSTVVLTVAAPAGAQAGDLLVAAIGFGRSNATAQPTLLAPAGWALASRTNLGNITAMAIFSHVFAAGETAYAWTTSVGVGATLAVGAYAGVDPSNPVDLSRGQAISKKTAAVTAPSVTTTGANEMLVAAYIGYKNNGSATTWTGPVGMTEIADINNGGARSGSLDNAVQAAAGVSGPKTANASAAQDYGIGALTALRPAPDTTSPVIGGVGTGSVSASGATVSWTTDEPSDSQVDYGFSSTYGLSSPLNATLVLSHVVTLSGLAASTTYHYRVDSRDASGNLATSTDFTFATPAPPDTTPPVISAVTVGSISTSGAAVSWTTDEASDSQVDCGPTSSYGASTPLDSTLVLSHSASLSGLAAGTTYHYRVKSHDAAGNLATSADFTFVTASPPDTTPPVISGVGASSITTSGATVSWSTDEVSDSDVDYGTTTAYGSSTPLDSTMVLAHAVALPGLAASTTYHYRVNSRDAAGNLATSGDFVFTTSAVPDTTAPVISGVAAGPITPSTATVSWTTDEASDTQVDYGTTSSYGSSTALDPTLVLSHSVTLSGLAPSTTYHFRVKSRDAAGNLAVSSDFTLTTAPPPDTTPPVISGVSSSAISPSGAAISWTTNEASDSQVDYGTTSSYGSSSALDSRLVLSHTVTLSGLASGTTYHFRVDSRDAAGNLAGSADFNFTTSAAAGGPVPIIVDTDIYSDADDVGALAIAFGLQIKGEATVVAIGVNARTSRPAVATNSWRCVAAIAQFYGSPNVPIGSDMPDNGPDPTQYDFIGPCAQLASASTPAPDTAVNVYRRALAAAPNGSVVVIAIGYEENLSALLNSPADSISPLNGHDLVSQKVKTLVVMGGGYPSHGGENNLAGNPVAAQAVASGWPTKIAWSGIEVGDAVHTGQTISSVHPANSPVRAAYEAFVGPNNWIYSYDLTAVYHAVRPADSLLTEVGPGTNVIDSGGGNVFTLGAGNQYYLSLTNATSLDSAIETLLDTLPPAPPDTTPPVISGVSTGSILSGAATISWTTDEGSDSQVEYGATASYGSSSALNTQLVTSHSVTLSGLAAASTYHYRVDSRDAAGNLATSGDYTFTTAAASAPFPNDTFDTNTIDASRWTVVQGGSTVAAANQELEITHPATASWTKGTLLSATAYDQTGKSVQVQVKRAANNGLGGATYGETTILLWLDSTHFVEFFIAGGAMTAWYDNGNGEVNLTPGWPAYSATAMQWLRFRESGGMLYWEYAAGATSPGAWTTLASMPDPFPMTAVVFKVAAGANLTTTDVARFDNISTY